MAIVVWSLGAPNVAVATGDEGCGGRAALLRELRRELRGATPLQLVCRDLTRDGRRDVVASLAGRPPYGATGYRVFRRSRRGGWRAAGAGRVAGRARGLLEISVSRRRLRLVEPLWRPGDAATCPTAGARIRVLRWGAGRLRPVRTRRVSAPDGCASMLRRAAPRSSDRCRYADPARPDIGVEVDPGVPDTALGKVLPGTRLRSTVAPHRDPRPTYVSPELATYPGGEVPQGPPAWTDVPDASAATYVHASAAELFNGDEARHRVAHDQAYAGLSPIGVGDVDGDGVEDLAQTAHWSAVDGRAPVGEVHLFLGRRHPDRIDPDRHVPDVVFYGEAPYDKFGIEVAAAGDVDRDGFDDILIAAAFKSTVSREGRLQQYGSAVYLVYGGPGLMRYRCPVKVRAEEIGRKVPGAVLEGGHDGSAFLGWTNTLDSGDFDGDGFADLVLGAYEMHRPRLVAPFKARAYVVHGGAARLHGTQRLGVGDLGSRESVVELPDEDWSHASTGFQTSFVGDLDRDGFDELAVSAARGGAAETGVAWIFRGRRQRLPAGLVTPVEQADLRIVADVEGAVHYRGLAGARPAGDVNGDGLPDVQLSARSTSLDGRIVGAVGVLHGSRELRGEVAFSALPNVLIGQRPGSSAGFPGMNRGADLDGDGHADLLLNDPYFVEPIGGTSQFRGRTWLVRGGPSLPRRAGVEDAAHRVFLADTRLPGLFGFQWNTGDFNDDGRPDIVIGDHYLGDLGTRERPGGAYLYYGGIDF